LRARRIAFACAAAMAGACAQPTPPAPATPAATAASAHAFVAKIDHDLADLNYEAQVAGFAQNTFITADTQFLAAKANDRYLAALGQAAQDAKRYAGIALSAQNTPYTRYFLSYILQFQFHKALCAIGGQTGPLNECSIFGNAAAGARYAQMLSRGASAPWQETMEKLTGTRRIDAAAITEYFQPLMGWLSEQNKNRQCGWE